jgi:hypothetical protein
VKEASDKGAVCFGIFDLEQIDDFADAPNADHLENSAAVCSNNKHHNAFGEIKAKGDFPKLPASLVVTYYFGRLVITDYKDFKVDLILDLQK